MRCAICDKEDETITFDRVAGTFSDCKVCQEVIYDTLITYDLEEVYLEELGEEFEREFEMDYTEY